MAVPLGGDKRRSPWRRLLVRDGCNADTTIPGMRFHQPVQRTVKEMRIREPIAISGSSLPMGAILRCFVGVGGLMLLAGCAGQEHYDRGRRLLAEGRYDRAVEAFDQASAEAPGNNRYHEALLEAKSLAADGHVKSATELVGEKRLSDALRELDIALKLMPAHPEGVPLAARIRPQIEECDKVIAKAREALDRQEWTEGARLITEAHKIDQSHPQLAGLRAEATGTVVGRHLAAARKALDARDWDAALAACEQARKVEPANVEAAEITRKVRERREAMKLFESGESLVAAGDLAKAMTPLQQAAALWADNTEIRSEVDRVKGQAVDQLAARARTEAQAGHYQAAAELLNQAMSFDPARDSLRQQHRQLLDDWGAKLMDEYRKDSARGAWELAWTAAVQALSLAPAKPEQARQACLTAEEGIRRGLAYNLNVLLAQSDEQHMNDILAVCGVLLEELAGARPDHVRLTEQSVLSKLLAEFSITSADVNNRDKLQAISQRLRGANAFLFVDMAILDPSSGQQNTPGESSAAAGAGETRLDLRMSLVDLSTGRLLWSSADVLPLPGTAGGSGAASDAVVHSPEPLTAQAIAAIRPAIRAKAAEMFRRRAEVYRQTAQAGEATTENHVRYLFDLVGMPDGQTLDTVLTAVFSPRMSGDTLAACKRMGAERLAQAKGTAAKAAARPGGIAGPVLLPQPRSPDLVPASTTVSTDSRPSAVATRPSIEPPPPSRLPSTEPAPAPLATTRPAGGPVRVFEGIISRDDDRHPKELMTVDDIVVKLKDTDNEPLDADIEIRVGKNAKEYKDKAVGARIGGFGQSGRRYVIVIVEIIDDTETVRFAVETVGDGAQ